MFGGIASLHRRCPIKEKAISEEMALGGFLARSVDGLHAIERIALVVRSFCAHGAQFFGLHLGERIVHPRDEADNQKAANGSLDEMRSQKGHKNS
jgi:hypothetical protein